MRVLAVLPLLLISLVGHALPVVLEEPKSLAQRLAQTTTRRWHPLTEEQLSIVYPSDGEQAVLKCWPTEGPLGESNCTAAGVQKQALEEYSTSNSCCGLSIKQPIGPGGFLGEYNCRHLVRADFTHAWMDGHGQSPSLPASLPASNKVRLKMDAPTWAARAWCALGGRSTVFVGDSTMKQTFAAFVMELRRTVAQSTQPSAAAIHNVTLLPSEEVDAARDGAVFWWGRLARIVRVEVSGSCGGRGAVTNTVQYVRMNMYADYDMPFVLRNDVIFANTFEVHYEVERPHEGKNRIPYGADLTAFLSRLSTHLRGHPERVLVMRSTLTQHFNTSTGDWITQLSHTLEASRCVLPPRGAAKQWGRWVPAAVAKHCQYRNLASDDLPSKSWNAKFDPVYYLLPLDGLFGRRPEMHPDDGDCTHYCWVPTLWHVVWEQLALVLEAEPFLRAQ